MIRKRGEMFKEWRETLQRMYPFVLTTDPSW